MLSAITCNEKTTQVCPMRTHHCNLNPRRSSQEKHDGPSSAIRDISVLDSPDVNEDESDDQEGDLEDGRDEQP